MQDKTVVHTGAEPGAPLEEERKLLDRPDIAFILRGRCETPAQVLEAVRDADVALCYGEPYTRDVFANAPRLKAVLRYGVGVDTIDLDAAAEYGVMVVNFPDFCTQEVANHALALMLACSRKLLRLDRAMRKEGWQASRAIRIPSGTIHDETVGLLAFGNIARAFARRAHALNMHVIAYDPYVPKTVFAKENVEPVTLEEVAERSDYISCHLPATAATKGLIDAKFFNRMKPTAYFVNTGRGSVVVEADLIRALQEKRIAGAGLDVYETEPIHPDHPYCKLDTVILTPHVASFADKTFAALYRRVGQAALDILEGRTPKFVANREALERRRTST